ncbi:MAG: MerR family transcriptional regulator [Gammaproteobacteria bacterium]|nr:MerR family transcriptional regulator [Gammaproteobacteria bacterium]
MTSTGFTSHQAAAITGASLRQLSYWRKTGLVVPSSQTKGGHARYNFTDLIALKAVRQLIVSGASLQRIRQNISSLLRFLPTLKQPLSEMSLVATGDLVLVFHQGSAFEALTGQQWIFEVAQLEREAAKIIDKNPEPYQEVLNFDDEAGSSSNGLAQVGGWH